MKYLQWPVYLFLFALLSSCIGEDFVDDLIDPVLRANNVVDTLEVGTDFQFEATFFNNVGREEVTDILWTSSDETIISITPSGLATAVAPGQVEISASAMSSTGEVGISFNVTAGGTTSEVSTNLRSGVIRTTTFYDLEGDFELIANDDGTLLLDIASNYRASASLPGLFVYLSNNPNSISGAFEISEVTVFSGAHDYEISGVDINDYNFLLYFCKPFNVKVGDGEIGQ